MFIEGHYDPKYHYAEVRVDGRVLDPRPSQAVRNHSNGFAWGYAGSGPAQLALAIALRAKTSAGFRFVPAQVLEVYQHLKHAFVTRLPNRESFAFDVDVDGWMRDALDGVIAATVTVRSCAWCPDEPARTKAALRCGFAVMHIICDDCAQRDRR